MPALPGINPNPLRAYVAASLASSFCQIKP